MGLDAEMFVGRSKEITDDEISELGYNLGRMFFYSRFNTDPTHKWNWRDGPCGVVSRLDKYDRERLDQKEWVEVNVSTRYYGPEYRRGDIAFLISVAEAIEIMWPDAIILYGHDCDSERIEFDGETRRMLFIDAIKGDKRWGDMFGDGDKGNPPLCPICKIKTSISMGGGQDSGRYGAYCRGCGYHVMTNDSWKTFHICKDRDYDRDWGRDA